MWKRLGRCPGRQRTGKCCSGICLLKWTGRQADEKFFQEVAWEGAEGIGQVQPADGQVPFQVLGFAYGRFKEYGVLLYSMSAW
jgi:hypothetical protein